MSFNLIDALDLNPRYNLRRTTERQNRILSQLNINLNMPNTPPPPPPSPPLPLPQAQNHQQQMYFVAQSTREPVARFTGYVPEGVQKRDQLMSYDVNRWLCDAETRAQVKGITDDVLKIKEAKMAVSPDYGDASLVVNTGRMNEIQDYNEFKLKCLKFWRPASERDRYHALGEFLSVQFNNSLGVFAHNLEKARMSILQDLEGDSSFDIGDAATWAAGSRSSEKLVSLNDLVNYFSWGVLFKAAPPTLRRALRKIDIKYKDDYVDILSSVQSEMYKNEKGVKLEVAAYANTHVRKQEFQNSTRKKSSSSNKSQGAVQCYRCEKLGHMARDCRVSLKCSFCKKPGHLQSRCFEAKGQKKQKNHGKPDNSVGASNSNVVDASDMPDEESDS